jgi:hypothetical protein
MGTNASLAPNTATSRPRRRSASSVTASVRPRHSTASANRHPAPQPATRPASATPRRSPSRGTSARPSRRHEPWKDSARPTSKAAIPAKPPPTCGRPSASTSARDLPGLRAFRTHFATAVCDGEARSHRCRAPRSPDQVIGEPDSAHNWADLAALHGGTRRRPPAPIQRSDFPPARWNRLHGLHPQGQESVRDYSSPCIDQPVA